MILYDGIRKNKFLIIGRVGIDFFPDPPGTKTEEATRMSVGMGGSSANIAAGIVKLGGKAALVTSVSDDSIGRYCLNQLKHYGIDHKYVKKVGVRLATHWLSMKQGWKTIRPLFTAMAQQILK